MSFDIGTLYFVLTLIELFSALLLVLVAWQQSRTPGLAYWAGGHLLFLIAVPCLVLRAQLPPLITVVVGNTCIALAYACIHQGMSVFTGRTRDWRLPLAVVLASCLPLLWLLDLQADYIARVVFTASGVAVLNFATAGLLLAGAGRENIFRRLMGGLFGVNAVIQLLRVAWSLLAPAQAAGGAAVFLLMWSVIFVTLLIILQMAMTAERLRELLRERMGQLEEAHGRVAESLQIERQARQEQSDFLAMVSHEFKGPLSVVSASNCLLQTHADGDALGQRESAKIDRAVERLNTLIENCLSDAWLDAALMRMQPCELDLREILEAARREELSDEQAARIRLRAPQRCPLVADPMLLRIGIDNLIDNALKYSPQGSPVELNVHPHVDHLLLSVADRGRGLAPGSLDQIFNKFYRGDDAGDRAGAGFGLHLVRRIALMHGGSVTAANRRHGGARFELRLPLRPTLA